MGHRPFQEYPKVVYGPNDATKTIHGPDEKPDGYFDTREQQLNEWEDDSAKAQEAAEATERRARAKAKLDDEGVKYPPNAQTATLEKRHGEIVEEKKTMIAALDKHQVEIPHAATHKALVDLTEKLEAFIVEQDAKAKAEAEAEAEAEAAAKGADADTPANPFLAEGKK